MSESGRLPTVSRLPYERPRCRHWRSQQGGKIMAAALPSSPPTWFRIVALLAVLWNAFGVAMYLSSVGIFGDPLAGLSEAERAAAYSLPRSDARRVGTAWVRTCGSRWSPYHDKKKKHAKTHHA